MSDMKSQELLYYKNVCSVQRRYINGEISKDEMDNLCGLERQKFSNWLDERNKEIQREVEKKLKAILNSEKS